MNVASEETAPNTAGNAWSTAVVSELDAQRFAGKIQSRRLALSDAHGLENPKAADAFSLLNYAVSWREADKKWKSLPESQQPRPERVEWDKSFPAHGTAVIQFDKANSKTDWLSPSRSIRAVEEFADVLSADNEGVLCLIPYPRKEGVHFRYLFPPGEVISESIAQGDQVEVELMLDDQKRIQGISMCRKLPGEGWMAKGWDNLPPAASIYDETARRRREQAMDQLLDAERAAWKKMRESEEDQEA